MNAICLVIDRLHVGHVGAYGNAWIDTPSLDRLACESFVFDQTLISHPRIETIHESVWQGRHPLLGPSDGVATASLPGRLAEAGVATALATDDRAVADSRLAMAFGELVELPPPERIEPAADIGATHLAACFARIIDWLGSAEEPFLLWVHLSSMARCWDAPREFRHRYVESGDPDPPDSAEVPRLLLPDDYDPDMLLGMVQAYAGQVSLLDTCIGALAESLEDHPWAGETLLAMTSARGFPLGEHRRVGAWDEALHGELVHVPMMIRLPGGLGAAQRSQALVTPADLRPTLLEWWSLADLPDVSLGTSLLPLIHGNCETVRDRLVLGSPGLETAIRTPAWHLRRADRPQLYVKPDDRWEVNDVADRCAEVVDELQAAADNFQACLESGCLDAVAPISEILTSGLE